MRIDILHIADCPNWRRTAADVRTVLRELGRDDVPVTVTRVIDAAAHPAFAGSPTVLIDGVDPFGDGTVSRELACRVYRVGTRLAGAPDITQLRDAVATRLGDSGPALGTIRPTVDVTRPRREASTISAARSQPRPAFTVNPSRDDDDGNNGRAPRDYMAHPEWFGQFSDPLEPADDVDAADARFIAANTQHWISNRVREGVLMNRTNMASFLGELSITSPDMTHDHVSRTLHGNEAMTLADLVVWGNEFGPVREVLTTVFEDSFRPTDRN